MEKCGPESYATRRCCVTPCEYEDLSASAGAAGLNREVFCHSIACPPADLFSH